MDFLREPGLQCTMTADLSYQIEMLCDESVLSVMHKGSLHCLTCNERMMRFIQVMRYG